MSTSLDKLRQAMESASPSQGEKNPTMMINIGNQNLINQVMVMQ